MGIYGFRNWYVCGGEGKNFALTRNEIFDFPFISLISTCYFVGTYNIFITEKVTF
jgi:hypothetical protein